jgi:glycosyltransferase involved in cell wall biosynthesis
MADPISVLHVINECNDGSISRIVERIIHYSEKDDFKWYVCATRGLFGFENIFRALGAQVEDCSINQPNPISTFKRIRDVIQHNKIRIIHSHTPRTIMEVWRAQKNINHPSSDQAIHLATKHLLTTPIDRKWGLLYTIYDHLTLYLPDHIVTVSKTMANQVKSQPGIRSTKVTAIPNAIPIEDFYCPNEREAYRRELGFTSEMIVIGFAGRITKVKNPNILIKAFASLVPQYPQLRLIFAGEGDLQSSLEELAKTLGIANSVIWPGFCSNIPGFLSALDIYVQPSANEGLSLSILEAMAAEKPVIATRVGSADEIIRDGITGLLIRPGSKEAIENAIITLLKDQDYRNRLAKNGKQHVFNEFNIQKMVDNYCHLYIKLDGTRVK